MTISGSSEAVGAKKRIAIVVASMDSGGAERVALNLAESFAAAGNAVDLVLVRRRGDLLRQVPSSVRIIDLAAKRAFTAIGSFRKYVRVTKPKAVIAVNFEVNVMAAAALLGMRRKPRLLLSVHCAPILYFKGAPRPWRKMMIAASTRLYRGADHIIAVSEGIADELIELGWADQERCAVVYNPVIRSDFQALARQAPDHPWFGERSIPLILNAARLVPQKNHQLLLHAFALVAARRPVRLALLGDGELRAELESMAARLAIANSVAFLGHRQNPYPYMREADLFVLSSAWEGFGNVLVEAMAVGTPVVSTDCPHGPREVLGDGAWGRLVPPGDALALADAICASLAESTVDPRPRAADFSAQASAERYLTLVGI